MATSQFMKSTIESSDELFDFCCSTCAENGKITESRRYCRNCDAYLCEKCLKDHNKFPLMRSHVVTDTSGQDGDSRIKGNGGREEVPKCSVHHANVTKFCKIHDEVCCQTCIAMKHRSCRPITDISIASKDVLTLPEYNEKISSLTDVLTAMKEEKTKRHGSMTSLANEKEKFLEVINSYREDLHAKINILADESQRQIKMKYSMVESKDQSHISTLDTVIATTSQTLQNMSTQNDLKAFVLMKTNNTVIEDCRALLHEMTHPPEDVKLEFTLNKDIMNTLNQQETLLSKGNTFGLEKNVHLCTVEVTGPPEVFFEKDRDTFEMYFENNKRSGGGSVKDIEFYENALYVTFETEEVAKQVAEKGDHVINKLPVSVKLFIPPNPVAKRVAKQAYQLIKECPVGGTLFQSEGQQPDEPLTKILLSNLPSTIHEEFISLFFESKKKLNAGTVLSIDYDEEQGTAIVEFEDPTSIDYVMKNCPIEMMGQLVNVEIYNPPPLRRCTVKVTGPSDVVCENEEDLLLMYFESVKKSGGGPVEEIVFEENTAFVTFESEEDALRVADMTELVFKKSTLTVQLYIPEPAGKDKSKQRKDKCDGVKNEDEPAVTVKVKGIKDLKSRDTSTLEFYFENTKRSGGEELKDFRIDDEDDDVLYVVYESPEVAKRVAERIHEFDGVNLITSLYVPPKPPPSYPDRVLIKGLKPTTTEDALFNFIEAKSGYLMVPGSMIFHGGEEGTVMIKLNEKPDFEMLRKMCSNNKLDWVNIKMSEVPISNCILVSNLPSDVTRDTLEFYFENKRKSGGGPVQEVKMNCDDTCFVYFENYEDVDSVLNVEHYLNHQLLDVKRYLKCLGRPVGEI